VVFRASDLNQLDYGYRVSKSHVAELAKVIAYAKEVWGQPVWLVGTSRGTVSGTATAIALGPDQVQGLVLTSSVTSKKIGAIASQNIASLKIPTLVVHHKNDACSICVPSEAARITVDLQSVPVKNSSWSRVDQTLKVTPARPSTGMGLFISKKKRSS